MASLPVFDSAGKEVGKYEISPEDISATINKQLLHDVVVMYQANQRQGSASTKTRAEVRGGNAKPWRQKGTGRARQGSIVGPHWRGGGVAAGPKPRDYSQKTPKKMKRLALASALSDRAADDKVVVIDSWGFSEPKTKDAIAALDGLGIEGRVLVVIDREDAVTAKSFNNLQHVHVLVADQLNTYDVLVSDYVVFTEASLPGGAQ